MTSKDRNRLTNEIETTIKVSSIPLLKDLLSKISTEFKFERGRTPLHIAAALGKNKAINFLLQDGRFDLDEVDYKGDTPLHLAALGGFTSSVELLLESDASVSVENSYGEIAIHAAVGGNRKFPARFKCALALINAKSEIDHVNHTGQTALHIAAMHGNLKLVKLLLDNGANKNILALGNFGTPEETAKIFGHIKVAKYIAGFSID